MTPAMILGMASFPRESGRFSLGGRPGSLYVPTFGDHRIMRGGMV